MHGPDRNLSDRDFGDTVQSARKAFLRLRAGRPPNPALQMNHLSPQPIYETPIPTILSSKSFSSPSLRNH